MMRWLVDAGWQQSDKNFTEHEPAGPGRLGIYLERLPESYLDDYGPVRPFL